MREGGEVMGIRSTGVVVRVYADPGRIVSGGITLSSGRIPLQPLVLLLPCHSW